MLLFVVLLFCSCFAADPYRLLFLLVLVLRFKAGRTMSAVAAARLFEAFPNDCGEDSLECTLDGEGKHELKKSKSLLMSLKENKKAIKIKLRSKC